MNPSWQEIAKKFATIFQDRAWKIRREIPTEGIAEKAAEAAIIAGINRPNAVPVETEQGPVQLPVEGLLEMFNEINRRHRAKIRELAESVGEITGEMEIVERIVTDCLVREEEDRIVVRVDGFVVSVSKDVAFKAVSLGMLP